MLPAEDSSGASLCNILFLYERLYTGGGDDAARGREEVTEGLQTKFNLCWFMLCVIIILPMYSNNSNLSFQQTHKKVYTRLFDGNNDGKKLYKLCIQHKRKCIPLHSIAGYIFIILSLLCKRADLQMLRDCLSSENRRHILTLTKAYTCLSPRVQWQWCRRSELQRTPLFSKHSYCGERLIIQRQRPRQPHLIAPQKVRAHSFGNLLVALSLLHEPHVVRCDSNLSAQ